MVVLGATSRSFLPKIDLKEEDIVPIFDGRLLEDDTMMAFQWSLIGLRSSKEDWSFRIKLPKTWRKQRIFDRMVKIMALKTRPDPHQILLYSIFVLYQVKREKWRSCLLKPTDVTIWEQQQRVKWCQFVNRSPSGYSRSTLAKKSHEIPRKSSPSFSHLHHQ